MSGIDEQDIVPNCPICGKPPNNWHLKTTNGRGHPIGPDIWIFPEERLAKENLISISRIKKPVMMIPVPHTKDDLVCALDNIVELVCTTCHRNQQSDVILVEKIKKLLIKEYVKAGTEVFIKLAL